MRKNRFFVLLVVAIVAAIGNVNIVGAQTVTPATESVIPSVGHGTGVGGSQWRTDVWIFNPSSTKTVEVIVEFVVRSADNSSNLPLTTLVVVQPGQTREFIDVLKSLLGTTGYGALYFRSQSPVVVTGRIYDANVTTSKGVGTSGQFFGAIPLTEAIGLGESMSLQGLAQDTDFRSNWGFVEVSGNPVTVKVQRLDGDGTVLTEKEYEGGENAAQQFPVSDLGTVSALDDVPVLTNSNLRVKLSVTGGEGKIIAFASRVDNISGDPTTVGPSRSWVRPGIYQIVANRPDGTVAGGMTVYVIIVDGQPMVDRVRTNFTLTCGSKSAGGYGGGFDSNRPFSTSTEGLYEEFWSALTPLYTGEGLSVNYNLTLNFTPDGRVWGHLHQRNMNQTGSFSECYENEVIFEMSGWYTGQAADPSVSPPVVLENGSLVNIPATFQWKWQYFTITLPEGQTSLEISTSGGSGDADLYLRYGQLPNEVEFDQSSAGPSNSESVSVSNPAGGVWYVGVFAYESIAGVSIQADWSPGP